MRLLLAGCLALSATTARAQTAEAPLSTRVNPEEGQYLVDANGMSLYLFKADRQGGAGTEPLSACEETACVGTWPPLVADGRPVGDDTIDAGLLGTMTRGDGIEQVTYNGWPLYYYFEDYEPGDINGDDIESFGEDWYLIGPNGDRARRDGRDDD
ncbi:MAG TPA: hypothetical protein VGN80_13660 [Devosiaceae bacterium]|jgi:predicted lipoprotein with Yx(FWY)xxD motif|nr:hypothetical protein [Devosiaceae bacterium]